MLQDFVKSKFGLSYSDDIVFSQEDGKTRDIVVSKFVTFFAPFSRQLMIFYFFYDSCPYWHYQILFHSLFLDISKTSLIDNLFSVCKLLAT